MGGIKTKAIQADLGTFMHNSTYSGMFRNYSGILGTLCNPGIFRTLTYSKPWHIQNQRHMQNPGIFRNLIYSEPWHIQNQRCIQHPVKHLRWSILQKILTAIVVFAISGFHVLYSQKKRVKTGKNEGS